MGATESTSTCIDRHFLRQDPFAFSTASRSFHDVACQIADSLDVGRNGVFCIGSDAVARPEPGWEDQCPTGLVIRVVNSEMSRECPTESGVGRLKGDNPLVKLVGPVGLEPTTYGL